MPKVTFVRERKTVECEEGANLREVALSHGIEVYRGVHRYLNCRGHGLCGKCAVVVHSGSENLSPPTVIERARIALMPFLPIGREGKLRLACQTKVLGDVEVETKPGLQPVPNEFWLKRPQGT